jgi:hypothetical protein
MLVEFVRTDDLNDVIGSLEMAMPPRQNEEVCLADHRWVVRRNEYWPDPNDASSAICTVAPTGLPA